MATVVFTAVGALVGGPIGAAIGAVVGQQVDAAVFAPKPRQGPRLGDLAIQTSSYGSAIPKIFGTMRIAGTVIWATDLREERRRSGGGKGRAATETYSYSASFAVALSGRPIRTVGRIWADGKLLRGEAGDFKSRTHFRLYVGDETQPVDPLIAALEGAAGTPAYRGIAYAVFEDLDLSDYGNRIPSLTFEVEADPGPVTVADIAVEISHGEIVAGETEWLGGFAASGDSVRSALEALRNATSLRLADVGGALRIGGAPLDVELLTDRETGAQGDESAGGRSEIIRQAAGSIPAEVTVTYYDVDRDFQTGLQRAVRQGATQRVERNALPAALTADAAKRLAERRLARLWTERETATTHLPYRRSALRPGAVVRLEGHPGVWSVTRWSLHRLVATVELVRVRPGAPGVDAPMNSGRPVREADLIHGPTRLILLDLPISLDQWPDRPMLYAATAGTETGWRHAALSASFDAGATWEELRSGTAAATIGTAATALKAAGSALLDLRNDVEVSLLNEEMWLESRSDSGLASGANLAALGDELIQFGSVEPLGNGRFRLSRLLRGRRGTEWAASTHSAGEAFVLLDKDALVELGVQRPLLGGEAKVLARGLGDAEEGVLRTRLIEGRALQPPAPVHFGAARTGSGDIVLEWTRRSRNGWSWLSGTDVPLGEERELYELSLSGDLFERRVQVTSSGYVYTAAHQAADGATGPIVAAVTQMGTFAASRPALLTLS
jgi:hypothetical protein